MRESIKILIENGYNGWNVSGGISRHTYEDIAIFSEDYLSDYKVKIIHGDNETDYMTQIEANQYLEKIRTKYENIKNL